MTSADTPAISMRRVAILINPASGKDRPILAPINRALANADIDWTPWVLKPDAEARAVEEAVATDPDAVWIYGGDGTISRVAAAMLTLNQTTRPIAVLGGGTANALAEALRAPGDLEDVLEALCAGRVEAKRIDVGMLGEKTFLLRATIGALAGMTNRTTREEKDRLGLLAYALSSLRALSDSGQQRFRIDVDGTHHEHDAISVIVANADGTGLNAVLASDLDASDRRLDVLVVPNVGWVTSALANAVIGDGLMDGCPRYRAREVAVSAPDPVDVHLDGEPHGKTPVTIAIRPGALTLLHYRASDEDAAPA
jgi:YegS/Rv2252/BmrU family lipid kinase